MTDEELDALTRGLWERGVTATERRSFTWGVAYREIAGEIRRNAGLPPLPYDPRYRTPPMPFRYSGQHAAFVRHDRG